MKPLFSKTACKWSHINPLPHQQSQHALVTHISHSSHPSLQQFLLHPRGRAKRGVILPMKRFILPLFLLAISATSSYAQKIYKGNSPYTSDILCHIDQGKVYKGTSPYTSDILARFDGTSVYSGNSPYQSDIILTYRKGKIYKGRSPYESDVLATWRDSKMYNGTSPYQSDILFTYKDNKVYRKNEPYSSSVLLTTSARVHPIILYLILFTFGS